MSVLHHPNSQFTGAVYYVVAQGNKGQEVFRKKSDYLKYLRLLASRLGYGRMSLYCFSLLPDSVHLLLEQVGDCPLSRFMQGLQTAYSRYFNRKYGRTGQVFRGRYKSALVDKEKSLKETARFIQWVAVHAGLVKDPGGYPWSGYRQFFGRIVNPTIQISAGPILTLFSENVGESRKAWEQFVMERREKREPDEFFRQLLRYQPAGGDGNPGEGENAAPSVTLGLPGIWKALLEREGLSQEPLRRTRSRLMEEAAYAATWFGGMLQGEAAAFFNVKQSTVSHAVGRLESRWSKDPASRGKFMEWLRSLEHKGKGEISHGA